MVGSEGGDTAEVSAGGGVAVRNAVVGVVVVLLAIVVPWAAAWVAARPGSSAWGPLLFIVGCVAVAGAVSGARRLTHHGVVVGLVVGLVALSSMEALWGYQSGSVLYRRLAPELEQLASAAQNAEPGRRECEPLPNGPIEVPGFGRVEWMCHRKNGTDFSGPTLQRTLLFVGAGGSRSLHDLGGVHDLDGRSPSFCIRNITNQWVERVEFAGYDYSVRKPHSDCPDGFSPPPPDPGFQHGRARAGQPPQLRRDRQDGVPMVMVRVVPSGAMASTVGWLNDVT